MITDDLKVWEDRMKGLVKIPANSKETPGMQAM